MKQILFISLLALIFIGTSGFIVFSTGVYNLTGSPGESTCANCHSGGGAATSILINATPAFNSNQYVPGQTYTIDITINNANAVKFGFDAEILNAQNNDAGSIIAGLSDVQLSPPAPGARTNAYHSNPKSGPGTGTFQFVWVAPSSGLATMYVSANAVGTADFGSPTNTSLVLSPNLNSVNDIVNVEQIGGISVFPNPSEHEMNIKFYLSENSKVKGTLVDLKGSLVAELFEGNYSAGPQQIRATLPSEMATGFYFLKIATKTEKTILVMVR